MFDVLAHFHDAKRSGSDWSARCPAHDDRQPSLSICEGEDGRWLLHCHAGCTFEAILEAAGLSYADVFSEREESPGARRTLVATYQYRDESGTHLFDVLRYEPKEFKARRADGTWTLKGVRHVLYGLPELQRQPLVHITEGEKDADRLRGLGLVATTSPFGAGKWRQKYTAQLMAAGVKQAIIFADNDESGRTHAESVARSCHAAGLQVKLITCPDLPPKGDVRDWLDRGHTREELLALTETSPWYECATGSPTMSPSGMRAGGERKAQLAPWPAPLSDVAFEGILGELVRAIAPHTEADIAGLLVQALTAFGNLIGRGPHCRADGADHYLNIYTVLVGKTAKGRKGTSWQQIRRFFHAADPTFGSRIEFGLSSGEGLIFAVRDAVLRNDEVVDAGVSDKRLLVTETEFAHVLKNIAREGNTLSAVIREAWDTGDLRTLTKNCPTRATGAHISIIGHITQDELRRHLTATEAANGFGNRFLWVCVQRSKVLPYGSELPGHTFERLIQALTDVIERAQRGQLLEHDASARELWTEAYPSLSEGAPGLLGAVTSRAEAQVLRLAGLYALTDRSSMSYVVRASHLRSAREVWRYCCESARYIFGDAIGDPTADVILSALKTAEDGLTRTEIRNLLQRNRKGAEIERALALLEEYGRAVRVDEPSESGRPVERWRLA